MSDASGVSSGSSMVRSRRKVVGVPTQCWCGVEVAILMSKSERNPYRRYHRCSYAASKKLENDNHCFKWVDEALLEEIYVFKNKMNNLEEVVKEITVARADGEQKVFEKMEIKLEKELFDRMEEVLVEAKWSMKKMCVGVVIGCIVGFVIIKLV
ncbi:hypothetical protein N665_0826s0001 [Sinapis alba]|nr:hypothetical protein N665_0826s0001 [Sinapis alba]